MSKIKTITVSNLKAITHFTGTFNGATAIILGGNNKGKTTFCRGLFDRIRGLKPEMVLKESAKEGFAECVLTTGEKFRWDFKEGGKEKLTYTTEKEIKMAASRSICDRFFPSTFDVDKFLTDSPAKQRKTLQELVGLDFSEIDERYQKAFKERTEVNSRYYDKKVIFEAMEVPEKVETIDLSALFESKEIIRKDLNFNYLINKKHNEDLRTHYYKLVEHERHEYEKRVDAYNISAEIYNECRECFTILEKYGFQNSSAIEFLNSIAPPDTVQGQVKIDEPVYMVELPDDSELKEIDLKIEQAKETNRRFEQWQRWEDSRVTKERYYQDTLVFDKKVKDIEQEKIDLIKTAKLPEGFSFTDDGVAYNGWSFNRAQLSSSSVYIAALKLASMTLGEVKALHFDASYLDNKSMKEIEAWAADNELQLFIELPDREGGEISYQIVENG